MTYHIFIDMWVSMNMIKIIAIIKYLLGIRCFTLSNMFLQDTIS
jgi:hypothetical protein